MGSRRGTERGSGGGGDQRRKGFEVRRCRGRWGRREARWWGWCSPASPSAAADRPAQGRTKPRPRRGLGAALPRPRPLAYLAVHVAAHSEVRLVGDGHVHQRGQRLEQRGRLQGAGRRGSGAGGSGVRGSRNRYVWNGTAHRVTPRGVCAHGGRGGRSAARPGSGYVCGTHHVVLLRLRVNTRAGNMAVTSCTPQPLPACTIISNA